MAEYIIHNGEEIDSVQGVPGDIVIVEPGNYSGLNPVAGVTYKAKERRTAKTGQWYFQSGANNVMIEGFVVTTGNAGGAFILNHANKNNVIRDCEMYECGSIGVDVTEESNNNIIEDCLIHDCHYAFHTSGGGCYNNIFRRNHCYSHSDGINVSPAAYGMKIIDNIIHDCGDDGIHCFDNGAAEVVGNLVYNCKGVALWVNGSAGIITKNNTVIGVPGAKWGYVIWIEKGGHIFKNNIIYVDAANMQMVTGGGRGQIDYNCWWNVKGAVSKVGIHDIVADPKFVDIGNNNYKLQSNSPCVGAGENSVNIGHWQNGGEKPMWIITGVDFVATEQKGSISGTIRKSDGSPCVAIIVDLSGVITAEVVTGEDGVYVFSNLPAGDYAVIPRVNSYIFEPVSKAIRIGG